MQKRTLGRTGFELNPLGFGAWAIGGTWGPVADDESIAALRRAIELGVNFFDTADVYGDGRSERLLARLRREVKEPFYVATKAGRRANPHIASAYTKQNLQGYVERSLRNLEVEAVDLLQLHCPPTDVYYMPEVFGALDELVRAGKLRFYGVSVERVEEALKALQYPNVQSVQIVFNLFRQRPAELLFDQVEQRKVGIIARLPLASGLLSGRLTKTTQFAADDHRSFNRAGAAFDKGETFSGVDYELGLSVVEQLKPLVPEGFTLPQLALAWILQFPAVTAAIPGGRRPAQVEENLGAARFPAFSPELRQQIQRIYDTSIKSGVHQRW